MRNFVFALSFLPQFLFAQNIIKQDFLQNKFLTIAANNATYCFKVSKNKVKTINNIKNCQFAESAFFTKSDSLCIETKNIVCGSIFLSNNEYFWGVNNHTVNIYNKFDDFDNNVDASNLDKKNKSLVNIRHIKKNTFIQNTTLTNLEKPVVNARHIKTKDSTIANSSKNLGEVYYKKAKKYYENKDYYNALKWARKSADLEYIGGFFGLGLAYELGKGGVEADNKKALKWYIKAANKGHTESEYRVGKLLIFDDGPEAEKWFLKAANKGHLGAQNNLGYIYQYGRGSNIWGNSKKAYKFYLMAAEQGSGVAQYNVCLSYFYGKGVSKNTKKAKEWCQKALSNGYGKASTALQLINDS